jgi:hypothetical protein
MQAIYGLEDGANHITDVDNLLRHATAYYKNLFGQGTENSFTLDPSLWSLDDKVTLSENEESIKPFSMEEIQVALFQMEKNKVAGPDGFIKHDILGLFEEFHDNALYVRRLNYGIIN